jgi:peptidyl-prolyl cis-trans isomerase A (cyclophilin A)
MRLTRKKVLSIFILLLFSGSILGIAAEIFLLPKNNDSTMAEIAVLETSKGIIEIELNRAKAPTTVTNFVNYVNEGFYNGLCFHRVIKDFIIQSGGFYPNSSIKRSGDPIQIESANGLKNIKGTIAMARSSEPNSATSQFYINTVDNPSLDYPSFDGYGYTVFGKVIEGYEVVKTIESVTVVTQETQFGEMSDWPLEPIIIIRAYMKDN